MLSMKAFWKFMKRIHPLKQIEDNSKAEYIIQKLSAFFIIYLLSAVVVEGIIICLFTAMGYDFLHGELPEAEWVELLPLYGFAGFGMGTLLYVRLVEKKPLSGMMFRFNRKFVLYFGINFVFGGALVSGVAVLLWLTGNYTFSGVGRFDAAMFGMRLLAYVIQGMAEELMCRGFLLNSLYRKTGEKSAVFFSTAAFILPHLSGLGQMKGGLMVTALINLSLVSVLFSLSMLKDNTIASACGLHVGWNFILSTVYGIQVSGAGKNAGLLQFTVSDKQEWMTGGNYGMEASVLLIPIFLGLNILYEICRNRKQVQYGI